MHVPFVFEHDSAGMAIPALTKDAEWLSDHQPLITIKIDGELCEVQGRALRRQMRTSEGSKFIVTASEHFNEDKAIFAAYRNALEGRQLLADGWYVAFGPGIRGNAQKSERPYMLRVAPCDAPLILSQGATKIQWRYKMEVGDLFEQCKAELSESPEIEGFVFQYEVAMMKPEKFAQVTRAEFGLPWPVAGALQVSS